MTDPLFTTREAWTREVEQFVTEPNVEVALRRRNLDTNALLAVARIEVNEANRDGCTTLTHEDLAVRANLPRKTVVIARLALIECGLERLSANPDPTGAPHRML